MIQDYEHDLKDALRELLAASQAVAWTECPFKEDEERYRVACEVAAAHLKEE